MRLCIFGSERAQFHPIRILIVLILQVVAMFFVVWSSAGWFTLLPALALYASVAVVFVEWSWYSAVTASGMPTRPPNYDAYIELTRKAASSLVALVEVSMKKFRGHSEL